jgi:hypothetical protein
VPKALRQLAYCYGLLVLISIFLLFPAPPPRELQEELIEPSEVEAEELRALGRLSGNSPASPSGKLNLTISTNSLTLASAAPAIEPTI